MPAWVLSELCKLIFSFFWKGKRDLVSRAVVVQCPSLGGFSVVDVKLKVWSLVVQWVRRFVSSPSSWSAFLHFWCQSLFGVSPLDVFSRPFSFSPRALPSFYGSLLTAWRAVNGAFSTGLSSLVIASSSAHQVTPVASITTKSVYLFLLSENVTPPHCMDKFLPTFGVLYWSTTWRELTFFNLDRPVVDFSWKVAHGVLYTADRLIGFGYRYDPQCFCGHSLETPGHLFFDCPLAYSVLSWFQSLLFAFSPLSPSVLLRHVLFGFNSDELLCIPRIFVYVLNVCKFQIWLARNDFRFRSVRPGAVVVIEGVKARVRFHLPLFFKRFKSPRRRRYFHRQWGARGVVASVSGGQLSLKL